MLISFTIYICMYNSNNIPNLCTSNKSNFTKLPTEFANAQHNSRHDPYWAPLAARFAGLYWFSYRA